MKTLGVDLAAATPFLSGHLNFDAGPVLAHDGIEGRIRAIGRTLLPDDTHAAAARTEGWIHLPTSGLADLPV